MISKLQADTAADHPVPACPADRVRPAEQMKGAAVPVPAAVIQVLAAEAAVQAKAEAQAVTAMDPAVPVPDMAEKNKPANYMRL